MAYTNVFKLKKSLKLLDTVEKSEYLLASLSVTQVNKISFMLQTIQKRERMFFSVNTKTSKQCNISQFAIYILHSFLFLKVTSVIKQTRKNSHNHD